MCTRRCNACRESIALERYGRQESWKKQVQTYKHTDVKERGGDMKEITFTNRVRIGDQKLLLDELPEEQRRDIVNSICYRSLLTVPNTEVIQTA